MLEQFVAPAAVIVGFTIAGIIFRNVFVKAILKFVAQTKLQLDDILVETLNGYVVLWFFLAGIKAAVPFMRLESAVLLTVTKGVLVVFIISLTLALIRLVSGISSHFSRVSENPVQSTTIFVNLIKIGIIITGLLLIFQSLGVQITPLLTALGVGGLAVALALQDTLSNLFAGLHIIFAGQIKVGDFVRLDTGQKGEVIDITWRNSTIKTRGDNIIVIPNSKMAQAIVVNFNLNKKNLKIKIPVGVAYESDLEKVEKITLEVAEDVINNVEGGVKSFKPVVRFHTFNDFSIDMTVIIMSKDYMSQYLLKHEFVKRLHKRFNKEGIVIPFPIRTVEMKQAVSEAKGQLL